MKETCIGMELNKYEYWMAGIYSITGKKRIHLKTMFPDVEELYRMKPEQLEKISFLTEREKECLKTGQRISEEKLEKELQYCIKHQIHLTIWTDKEYPGRLKHIDNPPYGIYYRGALPDETKPAIAIVGARTCSCYGRQMAEEIGYSLAKAEVSVISGMAIGIDGAGHRGALRARGKTYAVLGCGIDVCYPAGHRKMYETLIVQGGVVSEYPPHINPLPALFPQRNRIISGMSDCVIIVEAKKKSGSLITADFALEQGKDIYAVPGRVCDVLSQGTNRLIQQGAGIFLSIEDFKNEMKLFKEAGRNLEEKQKKSLEKTERLVYSCLDLTPQSIEELMEETELTLTELIISLSSLKEKGCVFEIYKNYFIANPD